MTKHFCDNCGQESCKTSHVSKQRIWNTEDMGGVDGEFEIRISFNGVELCTDCQWQFLWNMYMGEFSETPKTIMEPFRDAIIYTKKRRKEKGLPWAV